MQTVVLLSVCPAWASSCSGFSKWLQIATYSDEIFAPFHPLTDPPCIYLLRELVQPTEMVSSDARQMHMGTHLGPPLPPHASVLPGRAFPGAG